MNQKQKESFEVKKKSFEQKPKYHKKFTQAEIILLVLSNNPDRWYFTWELIGATEWGWLSHASHATLRKLEQDGKILKDYIDQYVVYTHKDGIEIPDTTPPITDRF